MAQLQGQDKPSAVWRWPAPPVGSRVRDAVAGIYGSRSLGVKTPSTWADWTRGTFGVHKDHVNDWNTAQPAPLGHAKVMHVGSERPWELRQ